jgi:hypothetical protein
LAIAKRNDEPVPLDHHRTGACDSCVCDEFYASGFAGGGVVAGIRLGVMLEIAAIGMRLAMYAVQPFPGKLILYGSAAGVIEMIVTCAIAGAIYKPAVRHM